MQTLDDYGQQLAIEAWTAALPKAEVWVRLDEAPDTVRPTAVLITTPDSVVKLDWEDGYAEASEFTSDGILGSWESGASA